MVRHQHKVWTRFERLRPSQNFVPKRGYVQQSADVDVKRMVSSGRFVGVVVVDPQNTLILTPTLDEVQSKLTSERLEEWLNQNNNSRCWRVKSFFVTNVES